MSRMQAINSLTIKEKRLLPAIKLDPDESAVPPLYLQDFDEYMTEYVFYQELI